MLVKCGRKEFDLNKDDIIMDNGACIQIITRKISSGWSGVTPKLPKTTFKKMIKDNKLVLFNEKSLGMTQSGEEFLLKYYRINEDSE